MMMRTWLMSLMVLCSVWAGAAGQVEIKGFHEWKNEKVQIALGQMAILKSQIQKATTENNRKSIEGLQKQKDQLKWNLDVAQDLSVTDYFVLYLSQQNQSERFKLAAEKMTTKEVAELMEAYASTLSIAPTEVVVRGQARPVNSWKGQFPTQAQQVKDQVK